ncbi:desmocollin-3-like [Protopterus annectens]|uniref:desmocollin-3-like n=1 Tax=Protopterus annectens TaxID=7888 RepID=UPI001CFB4F1C|nr:desmocollin-3-like [Protopterus annectens]
MHLGLYATLFLLMVPTACCSVCLKNPMTVFVPEELEANQFVFKVDNVSNCWPAGGLLFSSNDPGFIVHKDGSVFTSHYVKLPSGQKKISMLVKDPQKNEEWTCDILLSATQNDKAENRRQKREVVLKRTKRRWRPLPHSIMENSLGPFPEFVQQIRSDAEQNGKVFYKIRGPGVDEPPVGLFSILEGSGNISVHRPVDREEYPEFKFFGDAYFYSNNQKADLTLDITIKVEDANDNTPEFTEKVFRISVPENAKTDTVIYKLSATDRDENGTLNTKLKYKITSQQPAGLFSIEPAKGEISLRSPGLDREVQGTHELILEVRDMDGANYGRYSTGSAVITVSDVNDNLPFFLSASLSCNVSENTQNVQILRIPVDDKDLINSSNWRAKFKIISGNERGHFKIETDPVRNEGILSVIKPLDYEATQNVKLKVAVENEAPFEGSASFNTIPVDVAVTNVDEGPEFEMPIKIINVREDVAIGKEIGSYTAKDPETKTSANIGYKKLSDRDGWFNIDEKTGIIKTAKQLDRESTCVQNDEYNITVLAADTSQKSSTGTVVIRLIDVNDNDPVITIPNVHLCKSDIGTPFTVITANDSDKEPNSAPFTFSLPENPPDVRKYWTIEKISDTEAHLSERGDLALHVYKVPILIQDQQGKGSEQTATVSFCACSDGIHCSDRRSGLSAVLGVWAILAMIFAALLLLCIPLALFCGVKGSLKQIPEDTTQQHLIISNTEAPGENVMDGNVKIPLQSLEPSATGEGTLRAAADVAVRNGITKQEEVHRTIMNGSAHSLSSIPGRGRIPKGFDTSKFTTLEWQQFMWSRIGEKVILNNQDDDREISNDGVREYFFEGTGSAAGSVGCCSILGDEDRLDMLNNLGPRFKNLADICMKK